MISGMIWVLFVAYWLGKKERKRLTVIQFDYDHKASLTEEQKLYRRPKLFWFNAVMTIALVVILMNGWIPAAVLFIMASVLALLVNYPKLAIQQKILKSHGANIFLVSGMIFAADFFGDINRLGNDRCNGAYIGLAYSCSSCKPVARSDRGNQYAIKHVIYTRCLLFWNSACINQAAQHYGINPIEIGRAALFGQMTVGFPLSPLTASTFVVVGLSEVELADHQKFTFKWAFRNNNSNGHHCILNTINS